MLAYAANETRCRSAVLEGYFGEGALPACGVCDICLAHNVPGSGRHRAAHAVSRRRAARKTAAKAIPRGSRPARTGRGIPRGGTADRPGAARIARRRHRRHGQGRENRVK
ncbi:MAG: RecQ family zinc-binding domain-containing protein [Alistipes onderdonkii]